jgi:hypothetical protein
MVVRGKHDWGVPREAYNYVGNPRNNVIRENQKGLAMNRIQQLLICPGDVNLLGENINSMKKNNGKTHLGEMQVDDMIILKWY